MNNSENSRRKFLKTSVKGSAIIALSSTAMSEMMSSCNTVKNIPVLSATTGFQQKPLPYAFDALEPVIDAKTMEIHYTKHAAAYAKNLAEAAKAENINITGALETTLNKISRYSAKMRNNAGGHYNHELFWQCMRPAKNNNMPAGVLSDAITKNFQRFDNFKKEFNAAATSRFGSGWAWLYADANKNLKIGSTPNQDNPLMDVSEVKGFPLLGLDVWEHAYYLKYQNKRADYAQAWWSVVNWDLVEQRFNSLK